MPKQTQITNLSPQQMGEGSSSPLLQQYSSGGCYGPSCPYNIKKFWPIYRSTTSGLVECVNSFYKAVCGNCDDSTGQGGKFLTQEEQRDRAYAISKCPQCSNRCPCGQSGTDESDACIKCQYNGAPSFDPPYYLPYGGPTLTGRDGRPISCAKCIVDLCAAAAPKGWRFADRVVGT